MLGSCTSTTCATRSLRNCGSIHWTRSDSTNSGADKSPNVTQYGLRHTELHGTTGGVTPVGRRLFFPAHETSTGTELWVTDGTRAGTHLVKDIRSGRNGSYPSRMTDVNGTLIFSAFKRTHGAEPWRSDGTRSGTVMAADINPGPSSSADDYSGGSYLGSEWNRVLLGGRRRARVRTLE
jgi:ELWxxDGT repeat protein